MGLVATAKAMLEVSLNEVILDDERYGALKGEILKEVLEGDFASRKDDARVTLDGEKWWRLSKANLLTNLVLLRPFNTFKQSVTKEFMFDAKKMSKGSLNKYFNKIIEHFKEEDVWQLSYSIAAVIEELSDMSGEFNVRIGNTISIHSLIELAKEDPEFMDLIHTKIPDGMQFKEIENWLKARQNRMIEILSTKPNVLYNYLNSKTGINAKQLAYSIMNVGLKPDLFENVIPEPINTNYLHGLRNPIDFYINATGARKALITNFKKVKESGYLTRKLSLLMVDTMLDYDLEDCGTQHYMRLDVDSKDTLSRFNGGRWHHVDGELHMIDSSDESLIGQTLQLRSPQTCLRPKGRICRTCYGDHLGKLTQNYHVGILAVLLLTNHLTQMLLSSKHLLQTNSTEINWQPEFLEYFSIDRDMILLNLVDNSTILIDPDDIKEDEETFSQKIDTFKIRKMKGKPFTIKTEIDLLLTEEITEIMRDSKTEEGVYSIPIKAFNPDSVIFNIVMKNNGLSGPLQNILELIDTNSHLNLTDIHDIYNKFIELLNKAGIDIEMTHIELILSALIRDTVDQTRRPAFEQEEFPEYRVLRVTDAVLKSPSVSVSMAFEQIKKQFESPETYLKDGYSLVDEFL